MSTQMSEREKASRVLTDTATILRKTASERDVLQAERDELAVKVAAYERRTGAEKVAAQMHSKGINTDIEFQTLVASLEKSAAEGKLPTIEAAVEMVAPDMSFKTASIHDAPAAGQGGHDFERYLFGNIG